MFWRERILVWLIGAYALMSMLILVARAQGAQGMKKALMIIAEKDFRDEELLVPKAVLEKNAIEVKIASTKLGKIKGVRGAAVVSDMLVADVKLGDFDAIIFIGGAGAAQYWNDPAAHALANEAFGAGKVTAAICIAPVTLANAGLLKGKKATVWSEESGQLKAKGAVYTGANVEKDGLLITAAGPFAAQEFGETIVKALSQP